MTEDLKSPMSNIGAQLKSPLPYTGASNLRKIRRPSKPSNMGGGEISPLPSSAPPEPPTLKVEPIVPIMPEIKAAPAEVKPKVEVEEPKFEARWAELDEKLWKRIFRYCSYNDGSVPFLVRAQRV